MPKRFLGFLSKDIGIDLGTANTLVYVRDRGIVINEPSVVAINKKTDRILAVGQEAKKMLGRTPAHIEAIRPLKEGVISDFEVAEKMIRYFIEKVHKSSFSFLPRPRIVVSVPSNLTEVEKKAAYDASLGAGTREVYLIDESIAAAIGARLPIQKATGNLIVSIGGGTTEIAVISLGGIVLSKTLPIAGDKFNQDIVQYVRDNFNILLGEATAEEIKIKIGSAAKLDKPLKMNICGRDLLSGLPKKIELSDSDVRQALFNSVTSLIDNVKSVIEKTPPELVSDIMSRGIILVGGSSLLRGLRELMAHYTQTTVILEEDPLTTVVRGTGIVLENLDELKDVLCETLS